MKRFAIAITFIILFTTLKGITLQECLESLRNSVPISEQIILYEKQQKLTNKKLNANYLPSLYLVGNASWNSEVTQIDLGATAPFTAPAPDKDRESIGVQLQQTIWDGGTTHVSKQVNRLEADADQLGVMASVHQREIEATALYFRIISTSETIEVMNLQKSSLNSRLEQTESLVSNGLKEDSDIKLVNLDLMKLDNQIYKLEHQRLAAVEQLSQISGLHLTEDMSFDPVADFIQPGVEFVRKEIEKLDKLIAMQKVSAKLAGTKLFPKIVAKADYNYGKPGYDMFTNDFHDYYSVGINLSWKLWDFGQVSQEKRLAKNKVHITESTKDELLLTLRNQLSSNRYDMRNAEYNISVVTERIQLLEEIVSAYNSKFESGIITTTELLVQSNNLMQARIELQQNTTQLTALQVQRILISGGKL